MRAAAGLAASGLILGACSNPNGSVARTTDASSTTPSVLATTGSTEAAPEPVQLGDPIVVYQQGFEGDPPPEWEGARIATTPSGSRSFLGPFGTERVRLTLGELPDHDVMTVTFDLYVVGAWNGSGSWRLTVDGARIVNTTFSHTEDLQTFPANVANDRTAPGTGALESGTLGFTSPSGEPSDSIYRIEREFLHRAQDLIIDLSGQNLGQDGDRTWGIDNVEIVVRTMGARSNATTLTFNVVDQEVSVTGILPEEADLELVRSIVRREFPDRVTSETIEVGAGDPKPLWLYALDVLLPVLSPSDNFRLEIDESSASATGTVRTSRWRNVYQNRISQALGRHIEPELAVDVVHSDEIVAEIESARVLFAEGSSRLDDAARAALDGVAAILEDEEGMFLRVDGHTDSSGEVGANRDLSRERAEAARAYLVSSGVEASRLVSSPRGARELEVQEETEADRVINRRVSFVIPRG